MQFSRIGITVLLLLACRIAGGQAILKPKGDNGQPLHLKKMAANVRIESGIASTRLDLTYQNQWSARVEADFMYKLPPNTIITYFAYWYGKEKVIARIVEKERAAAIYSHITSRMRDPALIEMVGKRTFRARIFPIEPNSDLRVEMHVVQTLPADRKVTYFDLPLKSDDALESVRVDVRINSDPSVVRVDNSIGISTNTESEGYRIRLTGKNYRPNKDLRIRLYRKSQPLSAALYAARSSASDGYFALALSPSRQIKNAAVKFEGVNVHDVIGDRIPRLDAHSSALIVGRFRGSGDCKVIVSAAVNGKPSRLQQTVRFTESRVKDNPATKLWADRMIERTALSRKACIALSRTYLLPCKYTSWLAVPEAEMRRYREEAEREAIDKEIYTLTTDIAIAIGQDREQTRPVRESKARLRYLVRHHGERLGYRSADDMVKDGLYTRYSTLVGEATRTPRGKTHNDYRYVEGRRIARILGLKFDNEVEYYRLRAEGRYPNGDPLIKIEAPADAEQVIALMPDGQIKKLEYDRASNTWQARFDIPAHAREGAYVVTVVIVLHDGTRRTIVFRYHVDLTPPTGKATFARVDSRARLEVQADFQTSRVKAVLPSGEVVELRRGSDSGKFVALVDADSLGKGVVTYILIDRAHNVSRISVDPK